MTFHTTTSDSCPWGSWYCDMERCHSDQESCMPVAKGGDRNIKGMKRPKQWNNQEQEQESEPSHFWYGLIFYVFMVWEVHVGSISINYWWGKPSIKLRFLKNELTFWKVNLWGTDNNKLILILMYWFYFNCMLWLSMVLCWHRCAYQMSRGNGIISTITGRSRPAVTATTWHPFGNCLAPATCRFHKPAIRQWACISQHTLWNICLSACLCVFVHVCVCITVRKIIGETDKWQTGRMKDKESFLLSWDAKLSAMSYLTIISVKLKDWLTFMWKYWIHGCKIIQKWFCFWLFSTSSLLFSMPGSFVLWSTPQRNFTNRIRQPEVHILAFRSHLLLCMCPE